MSRRWSLNRDELLVEPSGSLPCAPRIILDALVARGELARLRSFKHRITVMVLLLADTNWIATYVIIRSWRRQTRG